MRMNQRVAKLITKKVMNELSLEQIAIDLIIHNIVKIIMGNSIPTVTLSDRLPNSEEYFLPQYGGKVLVNKHKKQVYKTVSIAIEEEQQFLELVQQRHQLKHHNFASLLRFQELEVEENAFCVAERRTYLLTYQLCAYTLFNEIQNCCKLKKTLPEWQICRIFQQVVECLIYLHSKGVIHGDIKVGSIFMDKNRNVKLTDSHFLKKGKTSYQVVLQDPRSMSLIAPEQLQLLRLKIYDNLQHASSRQMFTIGLSMIQATTIQQGMKCYNLQQLKVRDQFFYYMMEQIQSCGYSYQLSNLIMSAVHKDPKSRPNFMQFLVEIKKLKMIATPRQLRDD